MIKELLLLLLLLLSSSSSRSEGDDGDDLGSGAWSSRVFPGRKQGWKGTFFVRER